MRKQSTHSQRSGTFCTVDETCVCVLDRRLRRAVETGVHLAVFDGDARHTELVEIRHGADASAPSTLVPCWRRTVGQTAQSPPRRTRPLPRVGCAPTMPTVVPDTWPVTMGGFLVLAALALALALTLSGSQHSTADQQVLGGAAAGGRLDLEMGGARSAPTDLGRAMRRRTDRSLSDLTPQLLSGNAAQAAFVTALQKCQNRDFDAALAECSASELGALSQAAGFPKGKNKSERCANLQSWAEGHKYAKRRRAVVKGGKIVSLAAKQVRVDVPYDRRVSVFAPALLKVPRACAPLPGLVAARALLAECLPAYPR